VIFAAPLFLSDKKSQGGNMAKAKTTAFFCKECGYESAKWFGQCPACKEWNTLVEEPVTTGRTGKTVKTAHAATVPVRLTDITTEKEDRTSTGFAELDRVLGGGIVEGSLVLVGGDPGIGKSTLLLQMCHNLSHIGKKVLYISGEESLKQIKMRAERIGSFTENLLLLCETNLDIIEENMRSIKPDVVIIDSIQTMYREDIASAPGSVSQVRESTSVLMQLAKGLGISVFIVGHVTKEGVVAGPRVLEHMVDTVLYFEGDRYASYRILHGVKNRFGSTNEIGVFEMQESGLVEVENPSEYMLSGRPENASGSAVVCLLEGTRPMLIEVQALVCDSNFGLPRRTAAGTDYNRVNLLMAVLEKRAGLHMSGSDAYINVAGGLKVSEPALDLGIVMALVSSFKNRCIDDETIIFGEVGLSGEVRAVSQPQLRINEAIKLGFKNCIIPEVCLKNIKKTDKINIVSVRNVGEVIKLI
jgi:DNA repair protein RadA/Sms